MTHCVRLSPGGDGHTEPTRASPLVLFVIIVVVIIVIVIIVVVIEVLVVVVEVLELILDLFIVEFFEFIVLELIVFIILEIISARRPIIVTSHLWPSLWKHGQPRRQCGFFFEQNFCHQCNLTKTRTMDGVSLIEFRIERAFRQWTQ